MISKGAVQYPGTTEDKNVSWSSFSSSSSVCSTADYEQDDDDEDDFQRSRACCGTAPCSMKIADSPF